VKLPINAIELDTFIQCRATIDTGVVNDYAERMEAGDVFPPVDVYGTKAKCWLADGWHRVLAAKQRGEETINATLHQGGGRKDALKHALSANVAHGHRRTNADKRRCVEIALREFPKLSDRGIGKLCGVSHPFIKAIRPPALETVSNATRTTTDGRQYPAHRKAKPKPRPVLVQSAGSPGEVVGRRRASKDVLRTTRGLVNKLMLWTASYFPEENAFLGAWLERIEAALAEPRPGRGVVELMKGRDYAEAGAKGNAA
jgi:hypothetical protein